MTDVLGGFLVCDVCDRREPIGDPNAPGRLSTQHCKRTMRWAVAGTRNPALTIEKVEKPEAPDAE